MSVLIKGGHIVTAADDYVGDIYIEDGKVSLIGASLDVQADKVIDAGGKYVIPGAIDPHTHMEMPFGGTVSCDDFTSGTTSAAFGGTTAIVDFCLQEPGQSLPDALATWHEKIDSSGGYRELVGEGFLIRTVGERRGAAYVLCGDRSMLVGDAVWANVHPEPTVLVPSGAPSCVASRVKGDLR